MKKAFQPTWFRTARNAAGLTLPEMAQQLKVHVNTIENWECGRAAPSAGLADEIARVLCQPLASVAVELVKLSIRLRRTRRAA